MSGQNAQVTKAAEIKAPQTDGTNNSNLLLLASDTTHAALALPAGWEGCWVTIQCYGTTDKAIWFLASTNANAEVDRTIAAAADGAGSPMLGKRVLVGEAVSFELPGKLAGETLYLINETDDATTTAEIWLSSYRSVTGMQLNGLLE